MWSVSSSSSEKGNNDTIKFCSLPEKIKMIELKAKGNSIVTICEEIGRSEKTVRRWLSRWTDEQSIDTRPRSGRKRKLTHLEEAKMLVYLQTHSTATIREIKSELGLNCCLKTIDNYLKEDKVHSFKAPLKPSHFPIHLKARLTFSKFMKRWNYSNWSRVVFSDESSFRNHRSCARKVWRFRGVDCPVSASRFAATREIRINVWGAISKEGFVSIKRVSNNFDGLQYLETISDVLPAYFQRHLDAVWMQDNASIHRTSNIIEFFELHDIPKLMWPARSPDLNVIENIWGIMTRKLDSFVDKFGEATSEEQLWQRVKQCASEIPASTFENLYLSLPNRIKQVIEKKAFIQNIKFF